MGPRSHERGNGGLPPPPSLSSKALQWGRVLMNAETPKERLRRCAGHDGFNGAAFS